jgi:hypothetical protein
MSDVFKSNILALSISKEIINNENFNEIININNTLKLITQNLDCYINITRNNALTSNNNGTNKNN